MNRRKIFSVAIFVIFISLYLNAKEPPADLGYDPPSGWEYVMKLDSLSSFNIHCHNDTCILATSSYSNSKEIKYQITTNGGDTWEDFVDMDNWKFRINSNVLHRTIRQDNKSYYEISYDLLKTKEVYDMVNYVISENGLLESPIDSNLLIYSYKAIITNPSAHIEDTHYTINQISKDAGRNWEMLALNTLSGSTVHTFNFDWAEKGRFLYKVEDGYGYNLSWKNRATKYFETSDYGLTSQEIKFDPTDYKIYNSVEKIRLHGIDGPRTIREIPRYSESGISISQYDDSLKNTQFFDWLYIMDPSKPKSNQDSGYMRGFFYLDYHFDHLNYKNIVLRTVEFIDTTKNEDFIRYNYLYTSLNSGNSWILLNNLGKIPRYMYSSLDQGTKTLWIHVKDEESKAGNNFHPYKGSLWKLKLPWESTSVKDISENKSGLVVYPNPAGDYITIQLSNKGLKPFVTSDKVQIFDVLGIEVMSESIHQMTGSHRMNVEKLPAGVYFIRIGDKVEKFVKM